MRARVARPRVQVLERGSILFLYRPKSDVTHVQSVDDLERLYLLLIPDDREEHKSRVYGLGPGTMPVLIQGRAAPEERTRALAEEVEPDPRVAIDRLQQGAIAPGPGQRSRPWVRAAGEGRYVIFRHDADTHLAYVLDRPGQPGEAQQALQIGPRGNYLISVRAPGAVKETPPLYAARLVSRFRGNEWIPVEPSDFLDYPGTEVALLAADGDVEQELGLALPPGVQNQGERQAFQILHKEERRAAREGVALLRPMRDGRWA